MFCCYNIKTFLEILYGVLVLNNLDEFYGAPLKFVPGTLVFLPHLRGTALVTRTPPSLADRRSKEFFFFATQYLCVKRFLSGPC